MEEVLKAKPQARPKLDFPLLPQKGPLTATLLEKARRFEPMYKLPTFLAPIGKYANARPPRFHFGWALENLDRLYETATELGVKPQPCGEDLGGERRAEGEVGNGEEEEEETTTISMTELFFRHDIIAALSKHLQLARKPYLATVFQPGKEETVMVALVENYGLKNGVALPSDIESLSKHFGFKTGPMWYIDAYFWMWNGNKYWYYGNCVFDVAKEFNIKPHIIEGNQVIPKPEWVENDIWMQYVAFNAIAKNLGITEEPGPYLATVICPGKPEGRSRMVSLMENIAYKSEAILLDDIEKLRDCFGKYFEVDEGPMWYLDGYFWTWNSSRYHCE
ncbi:hypothetical protein SCHPADRAFT_996344 [Schizopora paradoxa]|uniref:Uncharacterized protein n=1 Tax=Schizopora paradoxa TaxID=27342 RepID=A0A0H2RZ82_9AGAM|nr:hypothetical protein SCHPADRAFT_996344 [Schizopora paradoxa]